ncbi:MAG TPA: hypothetical protein PKY88_07875 [Anaerohalosphaeraceae bacterium]|nr:hypothetical protein [Anaerohalosphaeraceae bacterium]
MNHCSGPLLKLNQWAFPGPFRIQPSSSSSADEVVARLLSETAEGRTAPAEGICLSEETAVSLCNALFRIERQNRPQSGVQSAPTQEQLCIQDAVSHIKTLLKRMQIEYSDPTGQAFTEGRLDFELIGAAEVRPGLRYKTIISCERPVVMIRGKLKQQAKGFVARP